MKKEHFTVRISKKDKRSQVHYFFDKIYTSELMTMESAYEWLALKMNMSHDECHFSKMKSSDIIKAMTFCVDYLNAATEQRLTDLPIFIRIAQTIHQIKNT